MPFQRLPVPIVPFLTAGVLMLGLTACGSGNEDTGTAATATSAPGTTGKSGQFKPERKAPDSAGDRKDAPDDVISDRPGGGATTPETP